MTEKTNDGWIEWHGGECPVPEGVQVEVQLRNGSKYSGPALGGWCLREQQWRIGYPHYPHPTGADIVRYRVLEPISMPAPEPGTFTIDGLGEYVTRDGKKAVVQVVGLRGEYSVCGYLCREEIDTAEQWTLEGRFFGSGDPSNLDIVGRWEPYKDIPVDALVWVKDEGIKVWVAGHFAGTSDGKPCTWLGGCTSHTTNGRKIEWDCLSLTKPDGA